MNPGEESNTLAMAPIIRTESEAGRTLRTISHTLALMPGSDLVRDVLSGAAHTADHHHNLAQQLPLLESTLRSAQSELALLRKVDDEEHQMVKVVIDAMRSRGSSINTSGSSRRELMRQLLLHLTVRLEDGEIGFDETNKLSMPRKTGEAAS